MSYVQAVQAVIAAEAHRRTYTPEPEVAQAFPIKPKNEELTTRHPPQLNQRQLQQSTDTVSQSLGENTTGGAAKSEQELAGSSETHVPTQPYVCPPSASPNDTETPTEQHEAKASSAKPRLPHLAHEQEVTSPPSNQQERAEGLADVDAATPERLNMSSCYKQSSRATLSP